MGQSIVVCGQKYDIGCKVVLWDETGGFNAYGRETYTYYSLNRKTGKSEKTVISGVRYNNRTWSSNIELPALQKVVDQFFLHHSGMYRSAGTFDVLHKERGLSVHFILDDDGTLYQTLDLKERAWHGGYNNSQSVGIEIDSRAHASKYPDAYNDTYQKKYGVGPRLKRLDYVQGMWINGYQYTDAQYTTLINLGIALKKIFPLMSDSNGTFELDFPRDSNGRIVKVKLAKPLAYKGLIGHYNASDQKNDPISFDHYRLLRGIKDENPCQASTFLSVESDLNKQAWLAACGYDPGVLDGDFGPNSAAALKKMQKDNGLSADGVWGPRSEFMIDLLTKEKNLR